MKKSFFMALPVLLGMSAPCFSHDLWVFGHKDHVIKADLIYGHNFPVPEPIDKDRLSIFSPVKVIGKNYEEVLSQKGDNFHYEGSTPLASGTYILAADYKPTVWSKKSDGQWVMGKTRKDIKEKVVYCEIASMAAKQILSIDDDGEFAKQLVGKGLEITPLVNAGEIKKDSLVKFKLTRDGRPVKQEAVFGSYNGFSSNDMSMPFYAKTDLSGVFEFKALKSGIWFLKSAIESETGDKDCETRYEGVTLAFEVKKEK